jgi:hypothetical protein
MRLIDYRRSDELDLVDAVFLDGEGRHWHFQKVDTQRPAHEQARPRIQLAELPDRPRTGLLAEGYDQKTLTGKSPLIIDSLWYELLLTALWARDGWVAVGIAFL